MHICNDIKGFLYKCVQTQMWSTVDGKTWNTDLKKRREKSAWQMFLSMETQLMHSLDLNEGCIQDHLTWDQDQCITRPKQDQHFEGLRPSQSQGRVRQFRPRPVRVPQCMQQVHLKEVVYHGKIFLN